MTIIAMSVERSIARIIASMLCPLRTAAAIACGVAAPVIGAESAIVPTVITLSSAGHRLLDYSIDPAKSKPYALALRSPSGINILRDGSDGHDHHHGLMFACEVNDVDFWNERYPEHPGRQRHVDAAVSSSGDGMVEHLEWYPVATPLAPLARERRSIVVTLAQDGNATLVTWTSELTAADGSGAAELRGRTYDGLGMRFVDSMDKDPRFILPAGTERPAQAKWWSGPAPWIGYTATAEGHPVTVALFASPGNPRTPTVWYTMRDFTYLSATIAAGGAPIPLSATKPVALRYGVAVWDGAVDAPVIDSLCALWVASCN